MSRSSGSKSGSSISKQKSQRLSTLDISQKQTELLESIPELQKLPEEKRNSVTAKIISYTASSISHHSGPLPPAEVMQGYENACPGAADRVIAMAERQQEHRMQMETSVVTEQMKQSGRGQIFGFVLGLAGLLGGSVASVMASGVAGQVSGGAIATSSLVALVALFLTGKKDQRSDLKAKS